MISTTYQTPKKYLQDMRMKFEVDSAVQAGKEVDRSQGAARAISVSVHILNGGKSEQTLSIVVH